MPQSLRRSLTTALLLGTVTGCAAGPNSVGVVPEPVPETVILGTYEGIVDTESGEISLTPEGGGAVGEARSELLATLDAGQFGTDAGAPAGTTDIVELVQVSRVSEAAWDTTNCGATPVSGVCVQIRARNLFASQQILRTYVELSELTPRSPTTDIAARSNTTSDADYGVTTTVGLWRYGRLNRAGITGDSSIAFWPFVSSSPAPARFSFRAVVKGQLVAPIIRVSTADGTSDVPAPTYATGTPGNATSGASRTAISATGDFVAFQSSATNLVAPSMPLEAHVYRKQVSTGTTVLVDVDEAGSRVTGCASSFPSMSSDGSKVAFLSTCRLVAADVDTVADVYVRDVAAGSTTLVSTDSAGTKATTASANPFLSPDGTKVAFENASPSFVDQFGTTSAFRAIYRRDLSTSTTIRIVKPTGATTSPNGNSFRPAMSSDGNRIVYDSLATNLRSPATSGQQIFLYEVSSDTTTVMSVSAVNGALANRGGLGAAISADGNVVAFQSTSSNLVSSPSVAVVFGIYARTVGASSSLARVTVKTDGTASAGQASSASLSGDGRYVFFLSQATDMLAVPDAARADAYVFDRITTDPLLRRVARVSVTEAGAESASGSALISSTFATISEDGVYAAFGFSPSLAGAGGSGQQAMRAPTF